MGKRLDSWDDWEPSEIAMACSLMGLAAGLFAGFIVGLVVAA